MIDGILRNRTCEAVHSKTPYGTVELHAVLRKGRLGVRGLFRKEDTPLSEMTAMDNRLRY